MIIINVVVRYVLFLYMLRLVINNRIIAGVFCVEYDAEYYDNDNGDYYNVKTEYNTNKNNNNNNIDIDVQAIIANEEFYNAEIILSQFVTYQNEQQVEDDINNNNNEINYNEEYYYVKLKELDYMNQYLNHIDKTIIAYKNIINVYKKLYAKASDNRLNLLQQQEKQKQQQNQNYVDNDILDEETDVKYEVWMYHFYLAHTYYSLASVYYLLLTSPLVQSLYLSYYYVEQQIIEISEQQYMYNIKKKYEKLAYNCYDISYTIVEILLSQVQDNNIDDTKRTTSTTTTLKDKKRDNTSPVTKVILDSITKIEAEVLFAYCSMRIGTILLYHQPLLLTTAGTTTTTTSSSSVSSLSLSKQKISLDVQQQQYQHYQTIVNNNLATIIEQASVSEILSYISDPTKLETIINDNLNTILAKLEEEHKEQQQRKTTKQQQQQQQSTSSSNDRQERIIKSKTYIDNAERFFRQLLENDDNNEEAVVDDDDINETNSKNKLYLKRHLASVLYAAAEIAINENDHMSAIFYYDECIELNIVTIDYEEQKQQQQLLRLKQEQDDTNVDDTMLNIQQNNNIYSSFDTFYSNDDHDGTILNCHLSIVDSLYAVSDVALRQGEYDIAKDRYHRAMEWIEEYDVSVQALYNQLDTEFESLVDDKQLTDLLQKLKEYNRSFGRTSSKAGKTGGSSTLDPMSNHGHHFFEEEPSTDEYILDENGNIILTQKDDGYEGDIYSSLGSMYMYKHEYVISLSYFQQAIRLYEHTGDYNSIAMANTKYSLSTLYFRIEEYSTSATEYTDALDIFQQVYGDNIDPFSISAQWKTIINNLDSSSLYDPLSIGALLTGVSAFNTGINGATIATATTASTTAIDSESDDPTITTTISNSNKQQITDEKNADVTLLNESKDNDITTILDDSPTIDHERNNDHLKTSNKNSIVLPSGSTIDIGTYLQQNKSLHDEL